MSALPPILSSVDIPLAELSAMRLDGELFGVEESFSPVDLPLDLAQRARSLAPLCGDRLIIERESAAWVWGALETPPVRHTLCSSLGARARTLAPLRVAVREVVIAPEDVARPGGVRVTTPLRTALDLARLGETETLRLLLAATGLTADDCRAAVAGRRRLPHKRLALQVLSRC